MKVLITGSSGRLGPYVVSELADAGHDLVLFSRKKPEVVESVSVESIRFSGSIHLNH